MTDTARKLGVMRHLDLAIALGGSAEGMSVAEIADRCAVSHRTAQRMRAALAEILPVEAIHDGGQTRYRIAQRLPAAFTAPAAEDLADLALVAAQCARQGQTDRAVRISRLHDQIMAALRGPVRTRLAPDLDALAQAQLPIAVPGPRRHVAPEVEPACRQAFLAGCTLRFGYTGSRGPREHDVAPRGLLIGPTSYLVAHGNEWGDPMLFRLDRIAAPEVTNRPAWPAPDFDLARFAAQSFGIYQEKPRSIVLRFDATVAPDARSFHFHPDQQVTALPDGRVEIAFRAGGLLELARHLFTWGGSVEIVRPKSLRRIMRDELAAAAARLEPADA